MNRGGALMDLYKRHRFSSTGHFEKHFLGFGGRGLLDLGLRTLI